MTPLDPALLGRWPDRFRLPALLQLLGSEVAPTPEVMADAVLRGAVAGMDELTALRTLVDDGHFDVVEHTVPLCHVLGESQIAMLRAALAAGRTHAFQQLSGEFVLIEARATLAGIPMGVSREDLESLAATDRHQARTLLESERRRIDTILDAAADELVASAPANEMISERIWQLARAGHLERARRLTQSVPQDLSRARDVPPPLEDWPWKESASTVLAWYRAPGAMSRAEFPEWKTSTPDGLAVVDALWALQQEEPDAARGLVQALHQFLVAFDIEADRQRLAGQDATVAAGSVMVSGDGWLGRLPDVLGAGQATPVVVHPVLDVYLAGAGEDRVPDRLEHELTDPFLAIGIGLERPESGRRSKAALVSLADLLSLVRVPQDRRLQLLRIAAPQWPLSVLSAGSADEWRRLLDTVGPEDEKRLEALSWVLDLAGLPVSFVAEALKYQTALLPEFLDVLVRYVDAHRSSPANLPESVASWVDHPSVTMEIEDAARAPFTDPRSLLAFWTVLAEGTTPGSEVDFDNVLVRAELSSGEAVSVVEEQIPALDASPLVERLGPSRLRIRASGVATYLAGQADQRLEEVLPRALAAARQAASPSEALLRWELLRYAALPAYQILLDQAEPTQLSAVLDSLAQQAQSLAPQQISLEGECEVEVVVEHVATRFDGSGQNVELLVASTGPARVPVRTGVLEAVLHTLIRYAAGPDGSGVSRIQLSTRKEAGLVEFDIMSDGPGIALSADRAYRLFVAGTDEWHDDLASARSLALRAGGDLMVVASHKAHLPVYTGARLRLVLPVTESPLRAPA